MEEGVEEEVWRRKCGGGGGSVEEGVEEEGVCECVYVPLFSPLHRCYPIYHQPPRPSLKCSSDQDRTWPARRHNSHHEPWPSPR